MKRREFLKSATLSIPVLSLLPGCAMLGPGSGTAWINLAAVLAEEAAYVGTVTRLKTSPGDRPKFEAANQLLASLLNNGTYDPVTFASALSNLTADWNSTLIISTIVSVWDAASQTLIDVNKAPGVQAVMAAVQRGISRGLAQPAERAIMLEKAPQPQGTLLIVVRHRRSI